jgi:hypothetical protein
MQTLRLEVVDSNTQHVVSVSVIGLQLLRVRSHLSPLHLTSSVTSRAFAGGRWLASSRRSQQHAAAAALHHHRCAGADSQATVPVLTRLTTAQVEWAPAVTMGGAVLQLCFSASTQCGACNCRSVFPAMCARGMSSLKAAAGRGRASWLASPSPSASAP